MTNPTTPHPVQEPAGAVEADTDDPRCGTVSLESELRFRHEHDIHNTPGYVGSLLWTRTETALASLQPVTQAKSEAVAWREYADQRLQSWRQRRMNKSGDRLELDDFMDKESLDDLLDYVLDEWSEPPCAAPQEAVERQPLTEATCEWSQDGNEDGSWFSACGGDPWYFESDDPTKNGMRFCIHCGKRMVQHGIGPATQEKPE